MPAVSTLSGEHLGHTILLEDAVDTRPVINPERAILVSIALHILIFIVLVQTIRPKVFKVDEEVAKSTTPVPIQFINPSAPAPSKPVPAPATPRARPPKPSEPVPESLFMRVPPPLAQNDKPFRMRPEPEQHPSSKVPADPQKADTGRRDTRPAGGEMGGTLREPTPGYAATGATDEPPRDGAMTDPPPNASDLAGRLRDFRKTLTQPKPGPPAPRGPEGGGHGIGGLALPNVPEIGMGIGNLEFESADYDWNDYARQIYSIIWQAWHRRLLMGVAVFEKWGVQNGPLLDHQTRIRFTIESGGQIRDVAIETPSGCYPLDDSAREALLEAVLPPLPQDFPRGQETVHARFIAEGDIRGMRQTLEYLQSRGAF